MPHTSDDTLLTAGLSSFRLDLVDHIAHLVLNRPDAFNTLNPRFWQELDLVLDTLQRSGQSRALVISSTGKHFCAGMALETFADPAFAPNDRTPEGRAAIIDTLAQLQSTFNKIFRAPAWVEGWIWWPLPAYAMPAPNPFSACRRSISA